MNDNNFIRVAGIVTDSIVDGAGLRFVLFVQGCPHKCEGCHNPQTHDFSGGAEMTAEEIFTKVERNPLTSGVTLSGGEPVCQAKELLPFVRMCKTKGLEIAMYSGYTAEEILEMAKTNKNLLELLHNIDTLIDGRFILPQRSLSIRFRGSKNQRIIDMRKSLESGSVVLDTSERWNG